MQTSARPLWKKSVLQSLSLSDIHTWLYEMGENGDPYGYASSEEGYYQEYKEHFDELSAGAYSMLEALGDYDLRQNWDDMTVALLGETHKVLGYDVMETDYFHMLAFEEDWAQEEAIKRIKRLSKYDMIQCFRKVMTTLVLFFDLKAAHDCLTSIVEELDERNAIFEQKSLEIDRLYRDLTPKGEAEFETALSSLPQRMWVE